MKFKFKISSKKRRLMPPNAKRKKLVLRGADTLRVFKCRALAKNYDTEAFGIFEEENMRSRSFSRLKHQSQKLLCRIKLGIKRYLNRPPRIPHMTMLGVFTGVLSVSLISALIVTFGMFFKYNRSYTDISIPNLLSLSADDALSVSNDIFEYTVIYKYNPEVKAGTVTAQSPLPDVVRKFYGKRNKIKLTLTVNAEQETFTLPHIEGTRLRDCLILLRSHGIEPEVIKKYSDTYESGCVFHCSVLEGTELKSGAHITIYSSLGKEKLYLPVPELLGKSENVATDLICKSGFSVGEIKYVNSMLPMGTVIWQSETVGSELLEKEKISLNISGGMYYQE